MSDNPFARIIRNPNLSPAQKSHALAVAAENSLPPPSLDDETRAALDARVICDMFEGNAPYKPRYVLPDYSVLMRQGSDWLELPAPRTLDEALNVQAGTACTAHTGRGVERADDRLPPCPVCHRDAGLCRTDRRSSATLL